MGSYLGAHGCSINAALAAVHRFDAWSNESKSDAFLLPTRLQLSYTPARKQIAAAFFRPVLAYTDTPGIFLKRCAAKAAPAARSSRPEKMGNDVAKNCANRMAIGAMSNVTDLERPVIQRMSEKLADIAKREGSKDLVTKEEFAEALNGLEITQSDRDILDRIFVMLDRTGEDRINHKEFIVGIVPFALGKTEELIQMAFELLRTTRRIG